MTSVARETLVICDASPLILLAKTGCLHLLSDLAEEVWIPEPVWREVTRVGPNRPEVAEIESRFASAVRHADPDLEAAYRLPLDAGEAAALALAVRNPSACLLIDDAKGRRVASLAGVRCIGTLGWLVRAKRAGMLPALRPLFDSLARSRFHVDRRIVDQVLASEGET